MISWRKSALMRLTYSDGSCHNSALGYVRAGIKLKNGRVVSGDSIAF